MKFCSLLNLASEFFQVENLLIGAKGQIKLCDFGSSTTQQQIPDESWTALQRSLVEDEVIQICQYSIKSEDLCYVQLDGDSACRYQDL